MAKIDMSVSMTNILGEAIAKKDKEGREVGFLTLKDVVIEGLLGLYEDERSLSGAEKVTRFALAKRIADIVGEVELTSEDIVLIKTLVAKLYGTLIVGQAFELLK